MMMMRAVMMGVAMLMPVRVMAMVVRVAMVRMGTTRVMR
jgi:hypothetical protein